MHIIVCLDENNGMCFAGRRQSMDSALRVRLLALTQGSRLWMNSYSGKQFALQAEHIMVAEDFLKKAGQGEYCFVENTPLGGCEDRLEDVFLCRWNRVYPSDVKFPMALLTGRHLAETVQFAGNSHDTITLERYTL